ncbi:MAG: alpha/beta hydrolase [Halanaerobiales bacterium]|nr:alpha/beta hydrolase [Halanaerobiales bacterium]
MFNKPEGKKVKIGNTDMDYVVFGQGQKPLIILPGLGDGLKTVKGQLQAWLLANYYKQFGKEFKIYIFSRKNQLIEGYSIREMARDQRAVIEKLGIKNADVMGISQGGMIAQFLAIDYPELVKKLIIGVSVSRQNETIQRVVKSWIHLAESNDYKALTIDTMEKTFSEKHLKKYRVFYPIISRIGKPKSFSRFLIQAKACLNHNAYEELEQIKCPTLIIGGDSDKVVGKNSSEEMAKQIENSKLVVYKGIGHGAYEETKDFNRQVIIFLLATTLE